MKDRGGAGVMEDMLQVEAKATEVEMHKRAEKIMKQENSSLAVCCLISSSINYKGNASLDLEF